MAAADVLSAPIPAVPGGNADAQWRTKHRKLAAADNQSCFRLLPDDLISDVARAIGLKARLVCKAWRRAVDDDRRQIIANWVPERGEIGVLARLVCASPSLETFTLRFGRPPGAPSSGGVGPLADALRAHRSLVSFAYVGDLRGAGDDAVELTEAAACGASAARRLSLEDVPLSSAAAARLAAVLAAGRQVSEVRLVRVGMEPEAARAVLAALAPQTAALELAHTPLDPEALAALARLLRGGRLRSLRLSGIRLGPAGCEAALVGPLGAAACGLESLLVARCGLGPEGALALLSAACGQPRLRSLSLCGEPVGTGTGAEAAGRLLAGHPSLRHCALSACGLQTEGAVRLVRAALSHPARPLAVLDLTGNAVKAEGQGRIYSLCRFVSLTVRVSW